MMMTEEWLECQGCRAVFEASDAICSSLDDYGEDYDLFCPFCENDFLLEVDAPNRRAEALQVSAIFLAVVVICGLAMCTAACTPYAGFVAGYAENTGDYYGVAGVPIREDGGAAIAYLGARREVSEHLSLLCQATHFSTFTRMPEVTVNHAGCGFEIR